MFFILFLIFLSNVLIHISAGHCFTFKNCYILLMLYIKIGVEKLI
ncbi:hypothetical protein AAJ76_3830001339 [Vairimorpha ceranae]|uniref:Uncharacterized protein n=1 Tax=Vairimorpha ceranae TaxID=40302 RepID=A0A0F9W9E3_9MICR|nr:hypothetical protein AAJ76_3830001339 [Vairimorpha ceranae]KKO73615.1 hypothetical protein AAJ76_3830001339 [Vairimorpha ceranae]